MKKQALSPQSNSQPVAQWSTGKSINQDPTFKFINGEAAPQELVYRQTMPKDLARQEESTSFFRGNVGQQCT